MSLRFWVCVALTAPLFFGVMFQMLGVDGAKPAANGVFGWIELALATPTVLWGGWPFLKERLEFDLPS